MADDKELSVREEIEAAMETVEEENPEVKAEIEEKPEIEAKTEDAEKTLADDKEEKTDEIKAEKTDEVDAKPTHKPPVGWSPTVKDAFKDLEPSMQEAIVGRERQIDAAMAHTSEARRLAEGFIQVVEPHRALLAAEGVNDPIAAFQGLLNVTAELKLGTPQQKAMRLAGLCQHYGVDIELLDQALVGQMPADNAPIADPRIDHIVNYLQAGEQQRQAATYQGADASVVEFSQQNDFMDDQNFRNTMADLLDLARNRGQGLSLDQAYQQTIAAIPEYAELTWKRRSEEAQGALTQKKKAGSSLMGNRIAGSSAQELSGMGLRDTIAAQFDELDRI